MIPRTGAESRFINFLLLRVLIATFLLGTGAMLYLRYNARDEAFFLLCIIIAVYLHTFLYFLLLRILSRRLDWLKVALIGFDVLAVSAVIALTGGKSSPFIFLYPIVIIVASIMFTKLAYYYVTAAFSWVMYLLIVLYQTNLEIATANPGVRAEFVWDVESIVYTLFNLVGFLLIAMLSGSITGRVRETGEALVESSESLRKLRSLHENILQSITSGVITLDLNARVVSANRMALRLLGLESEEEILDRSISEFIPTLDVGEVRQWHREEVSYRAPEGSMRILGLSTSLLRDAGGEGRGHIIIFQDLTDVKELEERLKKSEKLALLGQLAAGLAHEIRNPLSAISGALEIIADEGSASEDSERLFEVAEKELEKLNYMLEDFLILTYPSLNPDFPVEVGDVIRETVDSFLTAVRRSKLRVDMNLWHRVLYVRANPHRLKQVIWNLLQNAKQAMPEGGTISIETLLDVDEVVIRVGDEGVGIESEHIAKIFEPFFTTKEVGSGLGLAIAQKVIDGYNGQLNVYSTKGEGTTFVIRLPRCEEDGLEDDKDLGAAESLS